VFVNLLVMSMCCAKTVELIEMLFGMWTRERRLGLGNHYYVGPPDRWGQTSETVSGWGHHGECGALAYNVGSGGRAYNNEFILPKTVCFVTVHCHWCQSWGAQSAWCPQPRHWGVMREPAEICPWSIAQPYSLGGGSNAAASLLQQLAYCYATI